MWDDHDGPVLSRTVDALAGSPQVKGNVTGFHLGYGGAQFFFQLFHHIDTHVKYQGILALDLLHKHILHMGFGFYAVYEAVDMHFKPGDQVSVLPKVQAEQGIDPLQGFGDQLLCIQPFPLKVYKITGVVGSPLTHDDQGKHAHLPIVDRYVEPFGYAVKEGLGDLVFNGILKPLVSIFHIHIVGTVHAFKAGARMQHDHGKHGLMDGVVILLQHIHEYILDRKKVKAFVKAGQQVHVEKILLDLSYQQVAVKTPFAGLVPFQGNAFLVPDQFQV